MSPHGQSEVPEPAQRDTPSKAEPSRDRSESADIPADEADSAGTAVANSWAAMLRWLERSQPPLTH
jgi:hypothetical protein